MKICGLNKTTLLDYPGRVASTIFLGGCNFRCPFCHNSSLVLHPELEPSISQEEILAFLKKRKGILEGVCITGGEPTLDRELPEFLKKIRELGYQDLVKGIHIVSQPHIGHCRQIIPLSIVLGKRGQHIHSLLIVTTLNIVDRCLPANTFFILILESFALFHNASVLGRKAACLLTISDSFPLGEKASPEERQTAFTDMMKVALEACL